MVRGAACPIWDDLTSMAVLRYNPYNKSVVDVIRSRTLGKPINIVHVEPVGYFHFAHSYVRGNWSREETSSFALLAKSCQYVVLHFSSLPLSSNRVCTRSDIDILCHFFYPATPVKVSSFGSLSHFRKSSKPESAGSAQFCLECPIERECAYSAKKSTCCLLKTHPWLKYEYSLLGPCRKGEPWVAGRYHHRWCPRYREYNGGVAWTIW